MLFALKRFVSWFLDPTHVIFLLIFAGIFGLYSRRYARAGKRLLLLGCGLLAVFSNGAVAHWLTVSLEQQYGPLPGFDADTRPVALQEVRYVAVLGGGGADTAGFSPTNQLSGAGLARLVEAVRLMRGLPTARLITTGHSERAPTGAELLRRAAISLGVEQDRIVKVDMARDTIEETEGIQRIVGSDRFIIVTSAAHMPRTMGLLRKLGLDPIPAPVDFGIRHDEPFSLVDQLWSPGALLGSSGAMHEHIGMLWAKIKGRL